MINFRGSFVVVRSAVLGDLNAMKGCDGVVRLREGSLRQTTGAGYGGNLVEVR